MFFCRVEPVGEPARAASGAGGWPSSSRLGPAAIQVGVRWSMVTCAALSAIAGTIVTAVAPEPITTTRLPA